MFYFFSKVMGKVQKHMFMLTKLLDSYEHLTDNRTLWVTYRYFEVTMINPSTAGAEYIRGFIFY